jgi:hypothetical protein
VRAGAEGDGAVGVLFDQHPNGHSFAQLRGGHARQWGDGERRVVAGKHVCFGGRTQRSAGLRAATCNPRGSSEDRRTSNCPTVQLAPECLQAFRDGVLTNATDVEISG